jgi:hypothetical protein
MALKLTRKGQANVLDTDVGDALKEREEVSNQSLSSKLQEGQDDKKQLIVRKPNPFYSTRVGISTRRTKNLRLSSSNPRNLERNQASSALVA